MSIMNRGTLSVQEESFLSKLDRVADGLKAPHNTGEYKAAIHEVRRRALSSSTEFDHTMDQLPTMLLSDLAVPGVAPSPQPAAAQALKAAKLAHIGIDGLDDAIEKAAEGIKSFAAQPEGMLSYNAGESAGSLTLTGAGALCLQFLHRKNGPVAVAAMKAIEAAPCDWDAAEKHNNTYAWYYMTQAKFQQGGPSWDDWNDRMLPMLVRHQEADGHWFHGKTHNSSDVYDTCLCCLSLEVYYRYLPTFIEIRVPPTTPGPHEQRDIRISII